MTTKTIDIIYSDDKCSVVAATGDQFPSLLLQPDFAIELVTLLCEAQKGAETLVANPKVTPILNLCHVLATVLNRLGHEFAEWQVKQPIPLEQKEASIAYLDAWCEIQRLSSFLNR